MPETGPSPRPDPDLLSLQRLDSEMPLGKPAAVQAIRRKSIELGLPLLIAHRGTVGVGRPCDQSDDLTSPEADQPGDVRHGVPP